MSNAPIVKGGGTETERKGFAEESVERTFETASSMVAAHARAEIEAMYVMAMRRPRSDDDVRIRLLNACKRTSFAEKALYRVPRGDKPGRITGKMAKDAGFPVGDHVGLIEGLSIRFAEEAIRVAGNIWQPTRTVYDDDFKRMVNVSAVDLETNARYSKDVVVDKTIERAKPRDGAVILGQRENSTGKTVYIVQATEDELRQKEGSLVSKDLRTLSLRLLPGDTREECEQQIVATMRAQVAADPDAERKRLADGFAALNIMPSDLAQYLGHELSHCSPAELDGLRGLYVALKEGHVTWADLIGEKGKPADEQVKTSKATRLAEELKAKRTAKQQAGIGQAGPSPQTLSPEDQEKLRAAEAAAKAKRESAPSEREPGKEG